MMSNRRSRANANNVSGTDNDAANPQRNRIRGPHSALTDFLASNNISANQIRRDFEQRRQAAEGEAQHDAQATAAQITADAAETEEALAQTKKRKLIARKAVEKIKAGKKKKRKHSKGEDDSDEDGHEIEKMYAKAVQLPGQLENCAKCHTRFTVTSYSKAGPLGGLLCPKCSKDMDNDEKKAKPKKKPISRVRNRQIRSDQLDGLIQHGAKKLSQLCIQKIAHSINDVEDFGDLPPALREALSRILTKKRIMNSRTIDLMLNPAYEDLVIYDAASLTTDDFLRSFAVMPTLTSLRLDNAGQFKDSCISLLTSHPTIKLESLALSGANLISASAWTKFFAAKGSHLTSLCLSWIDGSTHFSSATLSHLLTRCPDLTRLKLHHLFGLTSAAIPQISTLAHLRHLTLQLRNPDLLSQTAAASALTPADLLPVLQTLGRRLLTLSVRDFALADVSVLNAIATHCRSLTKLRLTSASSLTDPDWNRFFDSWANPALQHLDLTACRQLDAQNPHSNDAQHGFCSDGFRALMRHSGPALETLTLTSCRHITNQAFKDVFISTDRHQLTYPSLRSMCVSFCGEVDDLVVQGMFTTCPRLERLKVFGCFLVRDVKVPRGVVLLGRSGGMDGVAIEGEVEP